MRNLVKNHYINSAVVGIVLTALSYLVGLAFGWIDPGAVNWLEVFAVFTSYGSTYLCVFEKRFNYVYAVFSTAAYAFLFYQWELYASMVVNLYLVPTVIYGFFRWRTDADTRPIKFVKGPWWFLYLGLTVIVYIGAVALSSAFGGAFAPIDSIILVGTILAQFLLDNKKIETWFVWAIVNVAAIYLYFTSGLFLAGFQYIFFLANTVWAFLVWRKSKQVTDFAAELDVSDKERAEFEAAIIRKDRVEPDTADTVHLHPIEEGRPVLFNISEDGSWKGQAL